MSPTTAQESRSMIHVGQENTTPIDLYYEDHGSGKPVVLIHGWPLDGASWEKQTAALLATGHRVITYDRRGFGKSSQPATGYEYDTFAADLSKVLNALDLHDVALVGFSMGGGEVARYLGTYGAERVSKAVFIGAVTPFLLKSSDNANGVDQSVFDGIQKGLANDRPGFLAQFLHNFYNVDVLGGKLISDEAVKSSWTVAVGASAKGTHDCVKAWYTDFRKDLAKIDVPTLVIHGEQDRIVPIAIAGALTHASIKGSKYVPVKDAPHGLLWTHAEQVNAELVSFLE
ncbi:MAG TPA: alpha/beta hydrolase [Candidatus Eisenbacteria bacterium]|nr:alpha/beta hydrolase [Candidatus Eisenbacteria bacterium]